MMLPPGARVLRRRSECHHRTDRLTFVHELKGVVDLLQWHDVGDEVVNVDLLVHVPLDDLRHVGTAAGTAEGSALPDAPGHQLERPRLDLLPRPGHADDDRDAPAAVTAFERLAHEVDVADALEAV